jgi:hypothetical protein
VAKEVVAIKYGNKTGHSITALPEAPFASKHPKPMRKGTKAVAAEAVVFETWCDARTDRRTQHRTAPFGTVKHRKAP